MRLPFVATLVALLALVGCNRESPKGGGGGPTPNTPEVKEQRQELKEAKREAREENTFRVQVPREVNVTRGKREEVEISLERNDAFKQTVKLEFKGGNGLKVIPADAVIKSGTNETKVFVEAAATAPLGEQTITVVGIPETGVPTSVPLKVDVNEK